jgi:hypothetical protein
MLSIGGVGEDAAATGDLDITDDLTVNAVRVSPGIRARARKSSSARRRGRGCSPTS